MQLRGTVLIGERKKENGLRLNNWRDYWGANFFCFRGKCFLWLENVLTKYNLIIFVLDEGGFFKQKGIANFEII